jgi:Peptidase family M48
MHVKSPHKKANICVSVLLFSLLQVASNGAYAGGIIAPAKPNSSANSNANPGASISDVYSDIDMRVRLAGKSSAAPCLAEQCVENLAFDARVGSIGRYLSKAAIQLYPQQEATIQRMQFSVADKQEAGTASNNKGQIVVLRGVQNLQLSDDALGFVIAREMSHVLAGHHKTNTSTKLIISALASVLFPAIAIVGASSAAAQASTATTLLTSAASTATSMLGGEVAIAKMKPTQLSQADEIAYALMEKSEWDMRSAQNELMKDEAASSAWMTDLETSRIQLANKIAQEDAQIMPLEDDFASEVNLADDDLIDVGDAQLQEALASEQQVESAQNTEVQTVHEIVLESNLAEEAELDGIKINALEANIDAASEAAPAITP